MSSEPSVFNLAIKGLLWCIVNCSAKGYSVSEVLKFKSMAYADDLAIVNQTVEDTEVMIARFANWSGVRFNVDKCHIVDWVPRWKAGGHHTAMLAVG